jgi:hypothetical protein
MLKSNRRWMRLVTLSLTVPLLVALCGTSSALAVGKPTGAYKNFTLCPLKGKEVIECLYSDTNKGSTGGKVTLGKQTVAIENPVSLQGGIRLNEVAEEEEFVNAEGGSTLSNSPQTVPGGLLEIFPPSFLPEPLKYFFEEYIINKGPTGVTATTEQVGAIKINESHLVNGHKTALVLPVRVHLNNSFLGSECYIGSAANPITFNLTTGQTSPPEPNKPITGKVGTIVFSEEDNLVRITENSLVDNAFSVPSAEGCVNYVPWWLGGELIEALANEVVDSKLGLPSAAGHNAVELNGTIEKATVKAVKASE